MKNVLFIAAILLLVSCNSGETESTQAEAAPKDRAIGFNTMLPELKFHLGTEAAIKVVKDLNELWVAEDYDAMRGLFADTAKFYFNDGNIASSADEFIKLLKGDNGEEHTWEFDYAYSVDLDPSKGGEHVQAGFSGTMVKDGVESKNKVHESYYIVEGKIVMWTQYKLDVKEKK
jgi:hypothetical protein